MAGIFDLGRPTGALGGVIAAEKENLNKTEQRVDVANKQAQFFDFLDGIEQRQTMRDRQVKEDQRLMREQETIEAQNIEEQKLAQEKANMERDLLPQQQEEQVKGYAQRANARNRALFAGAGQALAEAKEAGVSPQEAYARTIAFIEQSSVDPQEKAKMYSAMGINPNEYSPESLVALGQLTSAALHTQELATQEHLMAREWSFKLQEAMLAGGKPTDKTYGEVKPSTVSLYADMMLELDWFNWLEGGKDDSGNYTGTKASLAGTIANTAHGIKVYQKEGSNVTPEAAAGVLIDLADSLKEHLVIADPIGNKFKSLQFQAHGQHVLSELYHIYEQADPRLNLSFYDVWEHYKPSMVEKINAKYKAEALNRSKTLAAGAASNSGERSTGVKGGFAIPSDVPPQAGPFSPNPNMNTR